MSSELAVPARTPALLNLGCGSFVHDEWTNVDFFSSSEKVIAHNLLQGVPFAANSFDAVYHSHVLEHFGKADARAFLAECHRVLKPGGVLRIVVPDLEGIAREYVRWLDLALQGAPGATPNLEWITIELLDQLARDSAGGEMAQTLTSGRIENLDYITRRIGTDIRDNLGKGQASVAQRPSRRMRLFAALERLFGRHFRYYQVGKFRMSGESHKWMYDRCSLAELLREVGFADVRRQSAHESAIPGFARYGLDLYKGEKRGESSLFMEAVKPDHA